MISGRRYTNRAWGRRPARRFLRTAAGVMGRGRPEDGLPEACFRRVWAGVFAVAIASWRIFRQKRGDELAAAVVRLMLAPFYGIVPWFSSAS